MLSFDRFRLSALGCAYLILDLQRSYWMRERAQRDSQNRSPTLLISVYNRKGALVHDFHNTVSLIRTTELCLGITPMNFLDAHAAPVDIFTRVPDFTADKAGLPVRCFRKFNAARKTFQSDAALSESNRRA